MHLKQKQPFAKDNHSGLFPGREADAGTQSTGHSSPGPAQARQAPHHRSRGRLRPLERAPLPGAASLLEKVRNEALEFSRVAFPTRSHPYPCTPAASLQEDAQADTSQQFIQETLARGLSYQHLHHFKTASSVGRQERRTWRLPVNSGPRRAHGLLSNRCEPWLSAALGQEGAGSWGPSKLTSSCSGEVGLREGLCHAQGNWVGFKLRSLGCFLNSRSHCQPTCPSQRLTSE